MALGDEIQALATKIIEHVLQKGCTHRPLELKVRDLKTRMEVRAQYAAMANANTEDGRRAEEQLAVLDTMILDAEYGIIECANEYKPEDIDIMLKIQILDLRTRLQMRGK